MIIKIPFSGFYDSIHSSNIEYELDNNIFTDRESGMINNDRLSELAYDAIDWNELHLDYAREYVDNFNNKFDLNLVFESMDSPKEYNYITDRIFCEINKKQLKQLVKQTSKENLDKQAKVMFTSCDGFASFYDNNYLTWGEIETWDFNQLYCLLIAWIDTNHSKIDYNDSGDAEDWYDHEIWLMDDSINNGFLYDLICTHCTNKRLFVIHDYLNKRIERKSQ